MKNELIIFDFFGVICSEIAPYVFENHFDKETAARLKQEIFVDADLGKITMDEVFDKMTRVMRLPRPELEREWNSYIVIDETMVEYIKRLRKEYSIALLSNAPLGFVESLLDRFGLNGLFDKKVVSSAVKLAKPNIEVYKLCVSLFDKTFDKIYMVDDNAANLRALDTIGITPVHYTSVGELKKTLENN